MSFNVYEIVTNRILESLEKGCVPWRMPWIKNNPKNFQSKKEYRGINVFLLNASGYSSPWWLTYKQATEKNAQVRKGEKGAPVIFWKVCDNNKISKNGNPEKSFILRYYTVFNSEQIDGLDISEESPPHNLTFNHIDECERIVRSYKTLPTIDHGGDRAYYHPTFDRIGMPLKNSFMTSESYYATLFHELVHSTGHESRLKRDGVMNQVRFGSHAYSVEELVAEMGSAYLCAYAGIVDTTLDNSASYIHSWMNRLKREPRWLVEAAGKAQRASDYIMGELKSQKIDTEEYEAA